MEEACGVMNSDPDLMAPAIVQQKYDANADYVINEYMERLGTRLNILETELKYAWRALDLLSQEYIKMWKRLEKLEGLLYEQQSVISQLLDYYTSGGGTAAQAAVASLEGKLGELEVIREILGNGTIEDGLEEGFDVTISHDQSAEIHELELDAAMDEVHIPDEAFYKSLNQAYREDLVSDDPSYRISQLGMIWEEREEGSENGEKKPMDSSVRLNDSQEIYSALDYKDYRGSTSCVSEQDIAQLTEIDAIDHLAIEKLDELDRLSNKLHQDSVNIKHLRRKLLESPISISETEEDQLNVKNVTDLSNIDETLQKMFTDEKWSFTSDIKDKNELLMLAKSDLPSLLSNIPYSSSKSSSRFSLTDTDKEVAETLCGESRSPTSPRRKQIDLPTCNAPFTTVTGRLAYSAAVQHVEEVEAAAKAAHSSKNPFYSNSPDLGSLIAAPYEAVSCSTPSIFSVRSEKAGSPTLSICSIRTRQDGYVDMRTSPNINQNYSPPPPAPDMGAAFFPANKASSSTNVFLDTASAASSTNRNSERLSPKPHSPKSTKTSPRRNKHHSLSAAKSDSGLSSMSGWSSLEKSPGSPKTSKHNPFGETKIATSRLVSPIPVQYSSMGGRPFTESSVDSKISDIPSSLPSSFLPGGHHLSAFTTVKSPCVIDTQEGYGNFVPAPAPASDINVSPNKKKSEKTTSEDIFSGTCRYNYDQPAIYSVAGNNRDSYTTVYTGSNSEYISQSNNYPDLIEPYENNEFFNAQHRHYYTSQSYTPMLTGNTEEVQDRYKPITTRETDDLTNHEGYRTAMYRTMFPSGNITDALSYYPTSSRNENSRTSYDEQQMWLEYTDDNRLSDRSLLSGEVNDRNFFSHSPQPDRAHSSHSQQPLYENQQADQHNRQWSQRQEIPYLDLDLRNKNLPEYVVQQQHGQSSYYDTTGIIMTQSGYITISSNTDQRTQHFTEAPKKIKRANTLKSAMSSVSHWLPNLHLPKRNRSHSLPGIKRETIKPITMRKKKKNSIVSTVSDIIHKAKRRGSLSQQCSISLSDPEHSENEWSTDRSKSVLSEDEKSEDSSSIFSENNFETESDFPTMENTKQKRYCQPEIKSNDKYVLQPVYESESNISDEEDTEDRTQEEEVGERDSNGSNRAFLPIGAAKRNSVSSEKGEDLTTTENKMVVVVGTGASMEFAVSRALGRYRQRHSNSFTDDQMFNEEDEIIIEEITEEKEEPSQSVPQIYNKILAEQRSSDSQNSSDNNKPSVIDLTEEPAVSEDSPSTISIKSHTNRYLPKQQLSLEIPGCRDDDDCRSTYSWRSTSRVSSRRQSTEDSIDSEDEWYCYELRKLEEMERQTQLEQEMGTTLLEEPEPQEDEPDERVREMMSFVMKELRIKARVKEGVLDEKDNNLLVVQSRKHKEPKRSSFQLDNAAAMFEKIKHYHHEGGESDETQDKLEIPSPFEREDQSSGATSGPDSPHSTDEYDEAEMVINDEFVRCHLNSDEEEDREKEPESDTTRIEEISIPKIQLESSTPGKEEKDDKEGAQLGSRWKLLKTLKERKAEEKSNQAKLPAQPSVEQSKVSIMQVTNLDNNEFSCD